MVGRLVQQHQVGPLQGQTGQRQSSALAPGKQVDGFEDVIPGEKELGQVISYFRGQHPGGNPLDLFDQGPGGMQIFVRLSKITDVQAGTQQGFPGQRRNLVEDGLEKGGLTCAIGSDDGCAFAAYQGQIGDGEQGFALVSVTHAQRARAQHQLPRTRSRIEMEVQRAPVHRRSQAGLFEQAFQTLASPLCLASILPGNVAPDIFFFFFDELRLRLILEQVALIAFFTLVQIGRVITMIFFQIGGHLQDDVDHLIEEITVM